MDAARDCLVEGAATDSTLVRASAPPMPGSTSTLLPPCLVRDLILPLATSSNHTSSPPPPLVLPRSPPPTTTSLVLACANTTPPLPGAKNLQGSALPRKKDGWVFDFAWPRSTRRLFLLTIENKVFTCVMLLLHIQYPR